MKVYFIQLFVIFGICLVDSAMAYPKTMKDYQFRAQKVLDHYAKTFNTAYQFAATSANQELSIAAGVQHHETGALMTTEDLVPLGSLTKAYTTMAVMRLIDAGKMGFNDTIVEHADAILMRSNGTTLLELFKGDKRILEVTIYQLLHMRAGLGDYDDVGMMTMTMADPAREFTALDYIHMFEKDKFFLCDPGECERYSSNGFVLLGLALAEKSGATTWSDYD
jgi:CubicO group peptidase (beta-lactamase class C family)